MVVGAMVGGVFSARNPLLAERAIWQATVMSATANPEAVFMFSRATELQQREATYWGALGGYAHSIALAAEGEARVTVLDLSLIALREARANEPLFYFWHYQLGDALLYAASSTGQVAVGDAVESYERALELSPRNAVLANRLAVAYMVGEEWGQAALTLQEAAAFDPLWSETLHLKAAFSALNGDGTVASQALVSMVRLKPSELYIFARTVASRLLAYGLVEPMAASMLPALKTDGDEWAALSVRGVLMSLIGDADAAATLLTAAASSAPEDAVESVRSTASYLSSFVPGLHDALLRSPR